MTDYIYPIELIKKAQSRIRAQLDGNGINPQDITLSVKRQGQSEFTAETLYVLDCSVKTTQEKGRKSRGHVVPSGQTQTEIKSLLAKLSNADTLKSLAESEIKKLPLQGFGAEKQEIPLNGSKINLSEHHTCGRCAGQTKIKCNHCHGSAYMQCQVCYGKGLMRCQTCGGNGQIMLNGQPQICTNCQGRREITCTNCRGQRQLPCGNCQAKGYVSCSDCAGEGVNSIHTEVTPFLITTANIHVQDLDPEPKRMVALVTPMALVKNGHASYKITKPPIEEEANRTYYQDAPPKNNNSLFYSAQFPWAVGEIIIDKTAYNIYLTGLKGAISESGKFMPQILKPITNLIEKASIGEGNVAELLKQACNMRITRETLQAVASQKPKKAMQTIHTLYSIGFPKNDLEGFVKNAYNALKRITRRPRYIGLGIGLLLSSGIYYQWFINNQKSFFDTIIINPNIKIMLDGLPLIIGIISCFIIIKAAGFIPFYSVMKDIGINKFKPPVAGTAGIYGLAGNIVLWLIFMLKPLLIH